MTGATDATSSQPRHPMNADRSDAQCVVCSSCSAIYTCPRCTTKTCSLPCSAAHKTRMGCSGVRDKARFVPMNRYTHGAMMDDYVFLEDVGRRVGEWGQEIARGGYGGGGAGAGAAPPQGRRDRRELGRGKTRGATSGKKRDMLRSQLELRDVEIDMLPVGMERRTLNQSVWDPKKRTAFLTIEYNIHPPPALDARTETDNAQGPYTLLTHRNNFDLPLRDLFQSQISQRTKAKARADPPPTWVKTLALPHPDVPDAFTPPQFFIRAPLDLLSGQSEKFGFIKLDGERRLSALLRDKQFVEFPTIEVWEEGAFRGVLCDGAGTIELRGGHGPAKRRRLDVTKGRTAIVGLLGGYGSEDDGEDEEANTALTRLGEYEGSDAENEQQTTSGESDTDGLMEGDDDDEGELGRMVDPETLLAMVQEAQRRHNEGGDHGEVDWGESDKDS